MFNWHSHWCRFKYNLKKKVKYEKLSELFLDAYQAAVNEHLKIGTQRQIYQNRGNTHHD